MTKILSANKINTLLSNAIKLDSKYFNDTFIDCYIDDDEEEIRIDVYESYFNDKFYETFYANYHYSDYNENSKNRREFHKHLFEKWYGILKYIEKQYGGYDIDVFFNHTHQLSYKDYNLTDVEVMLEIDEDEEEEGVEFPSYTSFMNEVFGKETLITNIKSFKYLK